MEQNRKLNTVMCYFGVNDERNVAHRTGSVSRQHMDHRLHVGTPRKTMDSFKTIFPLDFMVGAGET